jgi:hypothetical protein
MAVVEWDGTKSGLGAIGWHGMTSHWWGLGMFDHAL